MKQQQDWQEHLDPIAEYRAGLPFESSTAYPLVAAAIIAAVIALLIALTVFGVLSPSIDTNSMLIGP
jgi:hypothetical protein